MRENLDIIWRGLLGIGSPASGIVVSLSAAEAWLRIASLSVGIAVGIVTLISLCRKLRKDG